MRADLEAKVAALAQQSTPQDLRDRTKELEARLAAEQEKTSLAQKEIDSRDVRLRDARQPRRSSRAGLTAEKEISRNALARVDQLNAQLAALREQLSRIAAALDVSEAKVKEQQGQIVELGKRLNLALVNKVEELARYRSEFFGRLREILGDRPDIRVVGDRFVFQSEVLFAPGSADLTDDAKKELAPVIAALKEISAKIPPDINWILRVDGHTDRRPISNSAVSVELGIVDRPRDIGGALCDRRRDTRGAARRGGLRRPAADRSAQHRGCLSPQSAHRAEADRTVEVDPRSFPITLARLLPDPSWIVPSHPRRPDMRHRLVVVTLIASVSAIASTAGKSSPNATGSPHRNLPTAVRHRRCFMNALADSRQPA